MYSTGFINICQLIAPDWYSLLTKVNKLVDFYVARSSKIKNKRPPNTR